MSLEFNKVIEQVRKMGKHVAMREQNMSTRLQLALALFYTAAELEPIRQRIDLVRHSNVSGYRGAAALDEILCHPVDRPPQPSSATFIAVDGSQIYPDQHAPSLYYLINLAAFTCYYGVERIPTQTTEPYLFYTEKMVTDRDGRVISNLAVNARRSVAEMKRLATAAWDARAEARPLVALHDGGLLKFFGANEIPDAGQIEDDYMDALQQLKDAGAVLAGYLDKPRSTYIISLLHLLSLDEGEVDDTHLKTNGELEGLLDVNLYGHVLRPGQRSAILVQNSPQNREYKLHKGDEFEIAFFYLNVSDIPYRPNIVRVDIPVWVARSPGAVDALHALLLAQCEIQGRRHYPYALTRADELAYVSSIEKAQLEELIAVQLLNYRIEREASDKLQTKGLARAHRQSHKLGG